MTSTGLRPTARVTARFAARGEWAGGGPGGAGPAAAAAGLRLSDVSPVLTDPQGQPQGHLCHPAAGAVQPRGAGAAEGRVVWVCLLLEDKRHLWSCHHPDHLPMPHTTQVSAGH